MGEHKSHETRVYLSQATIRRVREVAALADVSVSALIGVWVRRGLKEVDAVSARTVESEMSNESEGS